MVTGKKIRNARKARGLSQEQVGDAVHVSRQTVSNWETGMTVPSTEKLVELARLLGVSTSDLLDEEPPVQKTPRAEEAPPEAKPAPAYTRRHFWTTCALTVSILALALAQCAGFRALNQKLDRLLPEGGSAAAETAALAPVETAALAPAAVGKQPDPAETATLTPAAVGKQPDPAETAALTPAAVGKQPDPGDLLELWPVSVTITYPRPSQGEPEGR